MKYTGLIIALILLSSCSTIAVTKEDTNTVYGKLKLRTEQDVEVRIVNASQYKLKANIIEEIPNLRNYPNFTVIAWNNESYKTRNFCDTSIICDLKVDKKGIQEVTKLDSKIFKIEIKDEVRQPILCISYEGFTLRNVSLYTNHIESRAIKTNVPQDKKLSYDICYESQNSTYLINYEGDGNYEIGTFSTFIE